MRSRNASSTSERSPMSANVTLLADIGGTNARFALLRGATLGPSVVLPVAEHDSAEAAIRAALERLEPATPPRRAILAGAGPVDDDRLALTNGSWVLAAANLRRTFGFDRVDLVNDFEALAWALPRLAAEDLIEIGHDGSDDRSPPAGLPLALLGPGTGLGVAGFIPARDGPLVLVTEGGHATLAAVDAGEDEILQHLRARFSHVSAERVLSGPGLVALYGVVCERAECRPAYATPAALTAAALNEGSREAKTTLEIFCAMLGGFAGNLALTLGARGGVYLGGGILPQLADFLADSAFRRRFEAKGRFEKYLSAIPTRLIVHPAPAFLGLMHRLERAG